MARKAQGSDTAEMSKADAIRESIGRLGRRARPRDVIAELALKGVAVTSPQVSSLMKKMGIKRRRRLSGAAESPAKSAGVATGRKRGPRGSNGLSAGDLLEAKRLADQLGGVEKLQKALDVLLQLK